MRGAQWSDKGQLWMHVKALEALLNQDGTLPVNVRLIAEGEEEVGRRADRPLSCARTPERLKGRRCRCERDTDMFAPGLPTLCVGSAGA